MSGKRKQARPAAACPLDGGLGVIRSVVAAWNRALCRPRHFRHRHFGG
jgi:hypothetical protein